jgi:hypothetical protein
LKALSNVDRRVLYVVLILAVLYPLVKPLGLPFRVSGWTQNFYNAVDKLQAGDTMLMSIDYSVSGAPDVHPQAQAVFKHALSKKVKVVFVAFVTEGVEFANQMMAAAEKEGKKYGEDFVSLGFAPGVEVAISAFAQDILKVFPKDVRGNATADLPLMKNLKTAGDFKLITEFATGIPGPAEWIRQVQTRYKVPIASGVVTVMGPQTEPYYQSGQLVGLLSGLRSAAEYEVAMKAPGSATAAMDAQSMGHVALVLFVVLGNIAYLSEKGKKGRR